MAFDTFDIRIKSYHGPSVNDPLGERNWISAEYGSVTSLTEEYLLQAIIHKIADRFIEDHYAEIEKELDIKVIAAAASAQMGSIVEERLQKEIQRVQHVADEALRKAKKR
jgi:hypothetical protein